MSVNKPSEVQLDSNSKLILAAILILIILGIVTLINFLQKDNPGNKNNNEVSAQVKLEPVPADTSAKIYQDWVKEDSITFNLSFYHPVDFTVSKDNKPERIIIKPRDQLDVLRIEIAHESLQREFLNDFEFKKDLDLKVGAQVYKAQEYKKVEVQYIGNNKQEVSTTSTLATIRPGVLIRIDESITIITNQAGDTVQQRIASTAVKDSQIAFLESISLN